MGGKNARNSFSRNKTIERAKNDGKKLSQKSEKKRFFIFTRISCPKNGGKTRETIFPETQQIVREKYVGEKSVGKKCENTFFIITRMS